MTTPSHVPVLLDRVVALLAPALDHDGAVLVDATLGLGGHTEAVLAACELARVVGIDRDPEALALAGERLAPYGDPLHRRARGLRRDPRRPRRPRPRRRRRACSSTSASPRCSSTSSSAASPTARTHRSTCGWTADDRARPRPTSSTPTRPPTWPGCCGSTARSGSPARSPPPSSASPRDRAVHHLGPAGRAAVRRDPGARAAYRRAPGQAHLPGPAHGGQRRARGAPPGAARPPSTRSPSAAAWSWSPTTRWRTGWSSGPSPPPPAATSPTDLPFVPGGPRAGLPAGDPRRREGRRRRGRPQPARRLASGCAPSNDSPLPRHRGVASEMSSPAFQIRSGRIRAAGAPAGSPASPVRPSQRARLTVVPRTGPAPARLPFVTLVSFVLLAGVVGLLMFNTSMQQAAFAATALEQQADDPRPPASRRCGWSSTRCATRSGWPLKAQRMGMVHPGHTGVPPALRRQGARHARPRPPATNPLRLLPQAPAKPAVLDPPPNVVTVTADRRPTHRRGQTASGTTVGIGTTSSTQHPAHRRQPLRPGDRPMRRPPVLDPSAPRRGSLRGLAARCGCGSGSWSSRWCCRSSARGWCSCRASTPTRTPRWRPPRAPSPSSCPPSAATSWTATASRSPTRSTAPMVVADPVHDRGEGAGAGASSSASRLDVDYFDDPQGAAR